MKASTKKLLIGGVGVLIAGIALYEYKSARGRHVFSNALRRF